ncbi:HlyD family type I secretion periplasmic adaptor subunit [Mongoliimonas terrestris]|uniref:HlyD family type I secretion periplasmic adaptor subunit n=1 Tax=Mongoliimonas terrestris TaxID=1709001 RepID=UPI0009F9B10B|nr:HlyD family type I secretion periplasmic adaptor subunit [Mongoliimonas terrestris]
MAERIIERATGSSGDPVGEPGGEARASLRRHLMATALTGLLLLGGVGTLSATTELAGAVMAPGVLVVETSRTPVQHPTGGVVEAILVREGDRVTAGTVLMRLDATATRSNLAMVEAALLEAETRAARLRAERDGLDRLVPSPALRDRADAAALLAAEQAVLDLAARARAGRRAQLDERVAQLHQQAAGLVEQAAAKDREMHWTREELVGVRALTDRKLLQVSRLTALERTLAALEGARAQLVSAEAEVRGRISETRLQMLQLDEDVRSEAAVALREAEARIAELTERRVGALDVLNRVEIRAPRDGLVHELAIRATGGVVVAGQMIMSLVPEGEALAVEARIRPEDIDQVRAGQGAVLRLSAFDQRTTPEIDGTVVRVAADLTGDPRTGEQHYAVRIEPDAATLGRTGVRLVAGMPVEVFVRTGERTLLSYLTKPFADHLARAFRDG